MKCRSHLLVFLPLLFPALCLADFSGRVVRVIDGPFANFQGVVDEVFPEKGRVRVMVSIFGRETPVELEFVQVSNT